MTAHAPVTVTPGEVIGSALWNSEVRDQMLETPALKATQAGQLFQATGALAIAALNPVAYRMPRSNATGNLMEYVAGLNLAQVPVLASASGVGSGVAFANAISQSFTTHGGLVLVLGICELDEAKSGVSVQFSHEFKLVRDSTDIGQARRNIGQAVSNVWTSATLIALETPAAATYTYRVQSKYDNTGTSGTPAANAQLLIVELAP